MSPASRIRRSRSAATDTSAAMTPARHAALFALRPNGIQLSCVTSRKHQVQALLGEPLSENGSDPARSTGHERRQATKVLIHRRPFAVAVDAIFAPRPGCADERCWPGPIAEDIMLRRIVVIAAAIIAVCADRPQAQPPAQPAEHRRHSCGPADRPGDRQRGGQPDHSRAGRAHHGDRRRT